jgi:hypothetical protein
MLKFHDNEIKKIESTIESLSNEKLFNILSNENGR